MKLVLRKPVHHTWTLIAMEIENDAVASRINGVVGSVERAIRATGRKIDFFYQMPYSRVDRFLGWEYLGTDDQDVVLDHAMETAEQLGVELELN